MTTEAIAAEIERWKDRPTITRRSHMDQIEGIERLRDLLSALSTPPADDDLTDDEYDAKHGLRGPLDHSYPDRPTPPADDVREALATRLRKASSAVYLATDATVADDFSDMLRRAADAIEVRPRGTVTDAAIDAAAREYHERRNGAGSFERLTEHARASLLFRMRAAFNAAREARS